MKGLQLLATGGALPSRVVTNEDLRRQVDTSDEWITTRTGICQRYYCTENEDAATLAITAARQAPDPQRSGGKRHCLLCCGNALGPDGYPKHCLPRTGCLGSAGKPACL